MPDMTITRVKSAFAADESRKIRLRVQRKKLELAQRGKPAGGGRRAFGYNWGPLRCQRQPNERVVVPDADAAEYSIYEPEASAIRWAYNHLLNEGGAVAGCQREWIDRGLPTIRGGTRADGTPAWQRKTIRTILLSPRIAGLRQHQGKVVGDAAWEAIVPKTSWEAMGALLNDPIRDNRPNVPVNRQYPLRGILKCGICGRRLPRYHPHQGPWICALTTGAARTWADAAAHG